MKEKIKTWFYNLIVFPNHIIYSPFKNFDNLKDKKNGGFWQATIWILLFAFIEVLARQYTVFFLNNTNYRTFNGVSLFFTILIPLIVFIFANWAVTTIFSGSGTIKEIYQVLGFSLYPLIIFRLIYIIASNFVSKSDLSLLQVVNVIGYLLTFYLIFIGLVVIHEYGLFKNILIVVLTLFAFCVIFFIIFLIFMLLQLTTGFVYQFIEEIIFRAKL